MNLLNLCMFITLSATIIIFAQGISILVQTNLPPHLRKFGLLCILVTGLGIIGHALFLSGALVLSPELSLVMVQGSSARFGLGLLIVGFAVAVALSWHVAKLSAGWETKLSGVMSIGAIIGLLAATRLLPLNPNESEPLRVFSYDLWWAPLFIWLSFCIIESVFAVIRYSHKLARDFTITFIISGIILWAMRNPELVEDPTSKLLWIISLLFVFPATTIMATRLTFKLLKIELHRRCLWIKPVLILTSLGIGLLRGLAFWRPLSSEANLAERIFFSPFPALIWLGALTLILVIVGLRLLFIAWRAGTLRWATLPRLSPRQSILLLDLTVIAMSLAALFYDFAGISPTIAIVSFLLAWVFLAEMVSKGVLNQLYQFLHHGIPLATDSPLRRGWSRVRAWLAELGSRFRNWLKELFSLRSTPVALVKTLVAIVLLIALNEIPNAGKTIIQPFGAFGFPNDEALGKAIRDRLVNNLGLLSQQLEPEIIVPSPGALTEKGFKLVNVSGSAVGLDAIMGESGNLELTSTVKIPVSLFVAPIQRPMRALLDVRIIDGSLHKDRSGYKLLANSSRGESWAVTSTPADSVDRIVEELAFNVLCSNPNAAVMGMTSSWEAFQFFQEGLKAMQKFEIGEYDFLTIAIEKFREATLVDPGFALAHYRLGLALQSDGQPARAAEAFRASKAAKPEFITGYNALAYHLYNFDYYYQDTPAIVIEGPQQFSMKEFGKSRANEARRLWQQIILFPSDIVSLPERALAYHGLCQDALALARQLQDTTHTSGKSTTNVLIFELHALAYFYGQRALSLFRELSYELRSETRTREAEASLLNTLGVILESIHSKKFRIRTTDWFCNADAIEDSVLKPDGKLDTLQLSLSKGPYQIESLRYYSRARALVPDDPTIRSNLAIAAYVLGDAVPMQALEADASAHVYLAQNYVTKAKENYFWQSPEYPSPYYRLAINEYQAAIVRDPSNLEALNGYAYTFWMWRLHWPNFNPPDGAMSEIAHLAETYAHKAIRIAANKKAKEEAIYRSTLGEVLLGQGRAWEAMEVLEDACRLAPKYPAFDEIRWDLAQACICLKEGHYYLRYCHANCDVGSMSERASMLFRQILENERTREIQPFTSTPGLLDVAKFISTDCREKEYFVENSPGPSGPLYELREDTRDNPRYKASGFCDWLGVTCTAYGFEGESLQLHIWGGGVDSRIPIGSAILDNVVLSSQPRNTHDYYFAQLEDDAGKPVSVVYPIDTFEDCDKSRIDLVFDRRR